MPGDDHALAVDDDGLAPAILLDGLRDFGDRALAELAGVALVRLNLADQPPGDLENLGFHGFKRRKFNFADFRGSAARASGRRELSEPTPHTPCRTAAGFFLSLGAVAASAEALQVLDRPRRAALANWNDVIGI